MLAYKFSHLIRYTYLQAADPWEKGHSRGDPMITDFCCGTVSVMVQSWCWVGRVHSRPSKMRTHWSEWAPETATFSEMGPQRAFPVVHGRDCVSPWPRTAHVQGQATWGSPGSLGLDWLLEWEAWVSADVHPGRDQGWSCSERECRLPLWWLPLPSPCMCTCSSILFSPDLQRKLCLPRALPTQPAPCWGMSYFYPQWSINCYTHPQKRISVWFSSCDNKTSSKKAQEAPRRGC